MKLTERLNVLIQATNLSQKSGILSLDEAVKAKTAIDVISSGELTQNFISAINILIEIAVTSQKKGVYSLKDAHMIFIAIDGIEGEFQTEINKINGNTETSTHQHTTKDSGENVVTIPPKVLKKSN